MFSYGEEDNFISLDPSEKVLAALFLGYVNGQCSMR